MKKTYVIGGANVDIVGVPNQPLRQADSNPGKISISFGGVGRNIAENLAYLKDEVHLVSIFGEDALGHLCFDFCKKIGIKMEDSFFSQTTSTSTYMAVMDHRRDMHLAISDMEILQELDLKRLAMTASKINPDDLCVIDTNLDRESIHFLCENIRCPLILDPISTVKAEKVKDLLGHFTMIKPNRYEAEVLCGFPLQNDTDMKKAVNYFLAEGVKEVIISLGEDGIVAGDGNQIVKMKLTPVSVVNATGGGDSFVGAYVHAMHSEMSFIDRLTFAIATSVLTIGSPQTVDPELSSERIHLLIESSLIERNSL